ncbi:MAG: hypothetical protein HYZ72_04285 [Deltaproteobacteria bacterium]|nr:hypothetical protein [Deltaproteobacteria bacterium]
MRSRGEKGILYEIVDTLREGQHQEILAQAAKLRECIALAKARFGLEGEQTNLRQRLGGEFNILWVWLQETKTKKLSGYGAVDEGLERCLDPLLEEMTGLIDKALKTLAEA